MSNDLFKNLTNKKIALRGSGAEAEKFFIKWNEYANFYERCTDNSTLKINYIFDMSEKKQGQLFHNITIQKPLSNYNDKSYFHIIAIAECEPIIAEFINLGFNKELDFEISETILTKIYLALIDELENILVCLYNNNKINISLQDIDYIFHSKNSMLYAGGKIYGQIDISDLNDYDKNMLKNLLLENIINYMVYSNMNISLQKLIHYFPLIDIVCFLKNKFKNNIKGLELLYKNNITLYDNIKTIGIYALQYSRGGSERVLSLIIPLFINLGYKIVLFTDYLHDEEYYLPKEVKRIVLKNLAYRDLKNRLLEYANYIKKYNIDLMFYNSLHYGIEMFYETLFLKLLGIQVIAEVHNTFLHYIDHKIKLANEWAQIFRIMDKTIVLSHTDERYWKIYDNNPKYIPNPIENGKIIWNMPIMFKKRNGKTILWIGRTNANEKHLNDTIDIMYEVQKKIPDFVLKIVGETEGLLDYKKVIKEKNLDNNIEFSGYHSDVRKFYEEADLMLMTSEFEGFPMVLAESKIYGVPTVMYELSYLELTRDMRGIIEVAQRDKQSAADAIVKIMSNDKLRHRMSIEAKRSLYPFVFYDTQNAWKEIFNEISN